MQLKPPHANEILSDLRQPLLVFVNQKLWKILQVLIKLL